MNIPPVFRNYAPRIGRVALTLIVVGLALIAGFRLWDYYQLEPWTRDGQIRADVIKVAPNVSGLVTQVLAARD